MEIMNSQYNSLNWHENIYVNRSNTNGSIFVLPEELLLYIFSMLEIKDIGWRVPLVCRRWRKIANDEHLWKLFCQIQLPQLTEFPCLLFKDIFITNQNWKRGKCCVYEFEYQFLNNQFSNTIHELYYTSQNHLVLQNRWGVTVWNIYENKKIEEYGFKRACNVYYNDRHILVASKDHIRKSIKVQIRSLEGNCREFTLKDFNFPIYSIFLKHNYLVITNKINSYYILNIPLNNSQVSLSEAFRIDGFGHCFRNRELWVYQTNHQIAIFNFFKNQITSLIKLNVTSDLVDLFIIDSYILQVAKTDLICYKLKDFPNQEESKPEAYKIWQVSLSNPIKIFPSHGGSTLFALQHLTPDELSRSNFLIYDVRRYNYITKLSLPDIHPYKWNLSTLNHYIFQYINREDKLIFYDFRPKRKTKFSCTLV